MTDARSGRASGCAVLSFGAAIASVVFLIGVGMFGFSALNEARDVIEVGPGFVGKLAAGRYDEAALLLTDERRSALEAGELQRAADDFLRPLGKLGSRKITGMDSAEKGAARGRMTVTIVGEAGTARCDLTVATTHEGLRIAEFRFARG